MIYSMRRTLETIDIRTLRLLNYIYEKGGEIIGFRDVATELHMGYHTLKAAIKDLIYLGLIDKQVGPNNIMIIKLTDKGRKASEILKKLIKLLESD